MAMKEKLNLDDVRELLKKERLSNYELASIIRFLFENLSFTQRCIHGFQLVSKDAQPRCLQCQP